MIHIVLLCSATIQSSLYMLTVSSTTAVSVLQTGNLHHRALRAAATAVSAAPSPALLLDVPPGGDG